VFGTGTHNRQGSYNLVTNSTEQRSWSNSQALKSVD